MEIKDMGKVIVLTSSLNKQMDDDENERMNPI